MAHLLKDILHLKIRKTTEPSPSADAFSPFMVCQTDLCSLLFVYDTLRYSIIFFTMNLERKKHMSLPQKPIITFFSKSVEEWQDFTKNYLLGGQISQA